MKKKQKREKEKLTSSEIASDGKLWPSSCWVVEANRQLSNKWTVLMAIRTRVTLPDGRVLIVHESRALPAKQIGRKKAAPSAKKGSSQEEEIGLKLHTKPIKPLS